MGETLPKIQKKDFVWVGLLQATYSLRCQPTHLAMRALVTIVPTLHIPLGSKGLGPDFFFGTGAKRTPIEPGVDFFIDMAPKKIF